MIQRGDCYVAAYIAKTTVFSKNVPEIGPYGRKLESFQRLYFEGPKYIRDLSFLRGIHQTTHLVEGFARRFVVEYFFSQTPRIRSRGLLFLRGNSCKVVSFRQEVNRARRRPSPPHAVSFLPSERPDRNSMVESHRGRKRRSGSYKQKNSYISYINIYGI